MGNRDRRAVHGGDVRLELGRVTQRQHRGRPEAAAAGRIVLRREVDRRAVGQPVRRAAAVRTENALARHRIDLRRDVRQGRMQVHVVETELGVDRHDREAQRRTENPAVLGIVAFHGREINSVGLLDNVVPGSRAAEGGHRAAAGRVGADHAFGRAPVQAAGIECRVVPLELVEGLDRTPVPAPVGIGHPDRQQEFLDLGARTARRRDVDRVDLVDVRQEQAFAPVDDLVTQAQLQVGIADAERPIDIGIEQVDVGELDLVLETLVAQLGLRPLVLVTDEIATRIPRARVAQRPRVIEFHLAVVVVVLVAEANLAIFQRRVVPGLGAHQRTPAALAKFQVGHERERRREAIARIVVERVTVGRAAAASVGVAAHQAVGIMVEVLVRIIDAPARAHADGRVPGQPGPVIEFPVKCRSAARVSRKHRTDNCRQSRVTPAVQGLIRHQTSPDIPKLLTTRGHCPSRRLPFASLFPAIRPRSQEYPKYHGCMFHGRDCQ